MRKLLLILWLLMPVGAAAYHLGPGQDALRLDAAAVLIAEAEEHVARAEALPASEGELAATGAWAEAEAAYEEALALLPDELVATRRGVRLERAKCRMLVTELPEANADLTDLVHELASDPGADPTTLREARRALASSEYYMTWLMRLEGLGRDEWEPRIESARQLYKLLADQAAERGDGAAVERGQEDLESAIRLARMDLTELQGLPLPGQ